MSSKPPTSSLPFPGLAWPASPSPSSPPLPPPHHKQEMLSDISGMQACRKQASPSAAAELLQSCGWWRPHEQLGLIKADRAELFPAAVQVSFPTSSPFLQSCIKHCGCSQCSCHQQACMSNTFAARPQASFVVGSALQPLLLNPSYVSWHLGNV